MYDYDSGDSTEKKNYWWILLLLFLIILVVVGIIFRDKLRMWWMKFKSKFGKGKGKPSSPPLMSPFPSSRRRRRRILPRRTPPANVRRTSPGMPERRILLPAPEKPKSPSRRPLGKSKTQKELDGVLKKLKDMSK